MQLLYILLAFALVVASAQSDKLLSELLHEQDKLLVEQKLQFRSSISRLHAAQADNNDLYVEYNAYKEEERQNAQNIENAKTTLDNLKKQLEKEEALLQIAEQQALSAKNTIVELMDICSTNRNKAEDLTVQLCEQKDKSLSLNTDMISLKRQDKQVLREILLTYILWAVKAEACRKGVMKAHLHELAFVAIISVGSQAFCMQQMAFMAATLGVQQYAQKIKLAEKLPILNKISEYTSDTIQRKVVGGALRSVGFTIGSEFADKGYVGKAERMALITLERRNQYALELNSMDPHILKELILELSGSAADFDTICSRDQRLHQINLEDWAKRTNNIKTLQILSHKVEESLSKDLNKESHNVLNGDAMLITSE